MNRVSDQNYLLNEQYKTSSNLTDRATLHDRFSTNPYRWMRWVFDQYDLPEDASVLELGCGPASLWRENLDHIPKGWDIVLSDFSPGMLEEAKEHLQAGGRTFRFEQIDAQDIPFENNTLDAVIANHMLYHVPDRQKALSEIQRVLKPGGRLFAATNGGGHLCELREIVEKVIPNAYDNSGKPFALENGAEQLEPWFESIEVRRQETGLRVTEVEPLIDYITSGRQMSDAEIDQVREIIEAEIGEKGAIDITKESGMFLAKKGN